MKNENIIYIIGSILVITGAIMKILHIEYGQTLFTLSLVGISIFQSRIIGSLKKRIKELE